MHEFFFHRWEESMLSILSGSLIITKLFHWVKCHFLIPYFYFLIIYFFATKTQRHKVSRNGFTQSPQGSKGAMITSLEMFHRNILSLAQNDNYLVSFHRNVSWKITTNSRIFEHEKLIIWFPKSNFYIHYFTFYILYFHSHFLISSPQKHKGSK